MKRREWCLPSILGVLLGIALLVLQSFTLHTISHDDGISYIAATGHQDSYAQNGPKHEWVLAAEWQAFWTPEEFGCFRRIANGLAARDLHPPLFFWVLHIWSFLAGVALPSAPLLNSLFHILTTWIIYLTGRRLKTPHWIAGSVAACWLLGGASLSVAMEVRQYSLLGTVSSFFAWSLAGFLDRPSWKSISPLVIATTCGMLTHYHFVVLAAGCAAVAGFQLFVSRNWRVLGCLIIAICLGASLFCALHPAFYLSFKHQAVLAQPFAWVEIPERLQRAIRALLELFIPHSLSHRVIHSIPATATLILTSIGLIALAAAWFKHIPIATRNAIYRRLRRPDTVVAIGGAATMILLLILYVSCHSPRHAMSVKYLMVVTPLFFIALGQAAGSFHSRYPVVATVLIYALLVSQSLYGTITTIHRFETARTVASSPLEDWKGPLILDSVARGVLPTVLWHVTPDVRVFATNQKIIASKGLPVLPREGAVLYVTDPRYGNTPDGKKVILELFAALGYALHRDGGSIFGVGEVYELHRSVTPTGRKE